MINKLMKKKYNIFITGGTGFLGSNLVNELSKNNRCKLFLLSKITSNFNRIDKKYLKKITDINLTPLFIVPLITD